MLKNLILTTTLFFALSTMCCADEYLVFKGGNTVRWHARLAEFVVESTFGNSFVVKSSVVGTFDYNKKGYLIIKVQKFTPLGLEDDYDIIPLWHTVKLSK
jgi:hypothetical protein